tara:strand:- start:3833 stop:4510 length:678 start_codon:yes stop_codon:yes gene_type:complete
MELIKDYNHVNNNYTGKIRIIKYTEGENIKIEKEGLEDICEIIISQNDQEYNTTQKNHRKNYITNKKLEIADNVVKDDKYARSFTPKIIQCGLQEKNCLSSILYMNELYKINTIIFNGTTSKFYKTSIKDYPPLFCEYKNKSWHLIDNPSEKEFELNSLEDLSEILKIDSNIMIFKSKLESISKYKLKDLEDLCKQHNIDIMRNGKKKLKKQLYDDISLCLMKNE